MKISILVFLVFFSFESGHCQNYNNLGIDESYVETNGIRAVLKENKTVSKPFKNNLIIKLDSIIYDLNKIQHMETYAPGLEYYNSDVKYFDSIFKTAMNNNNFIFTRISADKDNNDINGITLIISEYYSNKKAKCDCDKIYNFYKNDWLDILTPYMSCSANDGKLYLCFITGIDLHPEELLMFFPNLTNY